MSVAVLLVLLLAFLTIHIWEEPTCNEDGRCRICGRTGESATGHDWEESTCTYSSYCRKCGMQGNPALGHDWKAATYSSPETCTRCLATKGTAINNTIDLRNYTDVDISAWYCDGIKFAMQKGLMQGRNASTFAPQDTLTRAELVTILYRMAGEPSAANIRNPFADVVNNFWYTDAILWAVDNGIINGTSNTTFSPGTPTTREQIATVLFRFAQTDGVSGNALAGWSDAATINDWARDAMNWAVYIGLINGTDNGILNPQGSATRAQIAVILMRYSELVG